MENKIILFICMMLLISCGGKKVAQIPSKTDSKTETAVATTPGVSSELKPAQPTSPTDSTVTKVATTPTEVIQEYIEELKKIVDPSPDKNEKRDRKKEQQIAGKVRQFFDFEGLAKMSLGDHWATATPAQRKEYLDLFINLIEDSYLRKTRDIVADYKIVYEKEEKKGITSRVYSRVIRNDADVDIRYDLHQNPKDWMIYNIDLDGVDLIQNYQSQFNRIIQQSNFNGLLTKLRKKRDEINKEDIL